MFDCAEEPLDEIAFTVEREVAITLDFPVRFGRDDHADSPRRQAVNEVIGVITLVAKQGFWVDKRQQRLCLCNVVNLAAREAERQRIA